jgi:hypothetical protein
MDFEPNKSALRKLDKLGTQVESLEREKAVMDVLMGYGLIGENEKVDLKKLVLKKEDLKVKHHTLSNEAAIALAYLDIQVAESKKEGVSNENIIDSIPEGLIVSLVTNRVARNDKEFINTIFANLKVAMSSRSEDFSKILLSVIAARQASIEAVVSGVVDSNNVVITDTEINSQVNQ